jgi:two-component system NtrC family response regulator
MCLDLVAKSAKSRANVLVTGETGTGKELFARAIHANSNRRDNNFVVIDCGALPETLMESILFGHVKGAYTGAHRTEDGLIRHAHKGTLFLDEIGELSPQAQKVFLRVLQEKKLRPVGSSEEVESDFRLVAASNRDLEAMVEKGEFRNDLLFRLRSIHIHLPPLRERQGDVKEIAIHYLRVLAESHMVGLKGIYPEFFDILEAYRWPGNVRELYSALEWTMAQALDEPTLFSRHLPANIRAQVARVNFEENEKEEKKEKINIDGDKEAVFSNLDFSEDIPLWQDFRKNVIEEAEKQYLSRLMVHTDYDVKKASELSGLSQPRIYELLRKYKISTK